MSVMRMLSVGVTLGLVLQGMGPVCAMYSDLSAEQQRKDDEARAAAKAAEDKRAEEEKQKISQAAFEKILQDVCRQEKEKEDAARKAAEARKKN